MYVGMHVSLCAVSQYIGVYANLCGGGGVKVMHDCIV